MILLEKKFLTYSELEEILNNLEETEDIKTLKEYVKTFKKLDKEKEKILLEKLKNLDISETKITEELIYQIINILPKDKERLRAVLKYSKIPFNEEEVEKILSIIKEVVEK